MSDHVYKHVELTGSSKTSIEDAVSTANATVITIPNDRSEPPITVSSREKLS